MRRRTSLLVLVLIVAVAVGVYAVDLVVEPVEPEPPVASEASGVEPVSGTWVCPVGDPRDGTEMATTVARPPSGTTTPSDVEVFSVDAGQRTRALASQVFDGSALTHLATGSETSATTVDWRAGPAVVQREWTLRGDDGDVPAGIVGGTCVEPFSERWIIPGMDTSGGAQAILRVANPFPSDATIAVAFVAPEGPLQPLALRNLSVEGRATLAIDVNEFLPERPDLAAIVTVASGRVGVEGYQLVRSAIGGVDGVSPLAAATEPSESWTMPWIVDGDDLASWLWVYNPGERQALLELTYHTPDGGFVPEGLAEVAVDPGQLRRVDLRGTLPEDRNVVSVSTRSDGAPVVVSAASELRSDDAARSGFAVQLGVPRPDAAWTVSGRSATDRIEQLHVTNPGGTAATLSVELFTGATVQRPEELQDLTVGPGAQRVIDLSELLGSAESWTASVTTASGEVVVARVGSSQAGSRNLVVVPGVPSDAWRTDSSGRPALRDLGLVTRFATRLGIARADPIPPGSREPATVPELLPDTDDPTSDDGMPDAPPDAEAGTGDQQGPTGDADHGAADADPDGAADAEPDGATDEDGSAGDGLDDDLFGLPAEDTDEADAADEGADEGGDEDPDAG